MYDGNDRYRLGLPEKPAQVWDRIDDFSPDHHPSFSRIAFEWSKDNHTRLVMLAVRGLGVLCLMTEGHPETGRMQLRGAAEFTKEEIGYAPGVL